MNNCPVCRGPMKPLFSGSYCPNDCDKRPAYTAKITYPSAFMPEDTLTYDPPISLFAPDTVFPSWTKGMTEMQICKMLGIPHTHVHPGSIVLNDAGFVFWSMI